MLDTLDTISNWLEAGKVAALATVVSTWGSAPRSAGAKMAVSGQGEIIGSVSGGCVEGAIVQEASQCLQNRSARLLDFGVSDENAWEVGLSCGGQMLVLVEPIAPEWWALVAENVRSSRPAVILTSLEEPGRGAKIVLNSDGLLYRSPEIGDDLLAPLEQRARQALHARKSQRDSLLGREFLIDVLSPPPRLILIGGAHVSMALQRLARIMGFRVFLVDPRKAFATAERFPEAERILHSYPDQALEELGVDSETYVAILTHDPKIDDPALKTTLGGPSPYIGVLSSRKTHQKRLARLREQGVDPTLLERIRTPIGLDIGAATPEEIALAIMAEIVSVKNRKME